MAGRALRLGPHFRTKLNPNPAALTVVMGDNGELLDACLPPVYSFELQRQKCSAVFKRFYKNYPVRDAGICAPGV